MKRESGEENEKEDEDRERGIGENIKKATMYAEKKERQKDMYTV